mgnify:CR=1 FL=1
MIFITLPQTSSAFISFNSVCHHTQVLVEWPIADPASLELAISTLHQRGSADAVICQSPKLDARIDIAVYFLSSVIWHRQTFAFQRIKRRQKSVFLRKREASQDAAHGALKLMW